MISVDEAFARVMALAPSPIGEEVAIADALGRALLGPASARLSQPPFNAAAMDGYALRQADLASPLRVIGESAAGHPWDGQALPGTAIRIFTGAPVPAGYDRVVMQENTTRDGDVVTVTDASGGDNIRPLGNDFTEGDSFDPRRLLTAADLGLLAAMNIPVITAARRPRVAVLATGDELLRPGQTPGPGQIICSNDIAIAALARNAGAQAQVLPIARDTEDSLRDSFARAADADLVVTIGGASVGDHDLVGKVAGELGMDRAFYKIAMRPGKPLMAGTIGKSIMIGLPGNPVSSIVCAILFMQPMIRAMQGLPAYVPIRRARLSGDIGPEGPRQHYLRATLDDGEDLPRITAFGDQDSARLALMSSADALLIRPAGDPARKAGEIVSFIPLDD
ncbi:molybdopterin molybdotransferase MoeA [Paracoccus sp. M683]|uniref:molybdopterin molybdotransferase MoeA n=1 Tax=Paracoccus sp. M683 TaxID=2594268 RepID=UPI001181239A|nr:gephyrin-like molybdotransferase Glp [Paracoccus sp. M683]TRW96840.1 molybdopterin molybdotransferase MoeA [Paracoccus sp. M683]